MLPPPLVLPPFTAFTTVGKYYLRFLVLSKADCCGDALTLANHLLRRETSRPGIRYQNVLTNFLDSSAHQFENRASIFLRKAARRSGVV
jgi:hypothetical protein